MGSCSFPGSSVLAVVDSCSIRALKATTSPYCHPDVPHLAASLPVSSPAALLSVFHRLRQSDLLKSKSDCVISLPKSLMASQHPQSRLCTPCHGLPAPPASLYHLSTLRSAHSIPATVAFLRFLFLASGPLHLLFCT